MRGEKKIRVEIAIDRVCLLMLKERYGKRMGDKRVVEIACAEVVGYAAEDYLRKKGLSQSESEGA